MKKIFGVCGWFLRLVGGISESLIIGAVSIALMAWLFVSYPELGLDAMDGNLAVFKWLSGFLGTHSAHAELSLRLLGGDKLVMMAEIGIILKLLSFLIRSVCSWSWKKVANRNRKSALDY